MLDDGRITDGQGRTVDFKNTIIILTSNLGSDLILSEMEQGELTGETQELLNKLLRSKFRPEFINRLDEIVYFRALTAENMRGIIELQLKELSRRMAERGLKLAVTEKAKDAILENGTDQVFGARPIKRFIQGRIESLIARFIIAESPEEGSTVTVDYNGAEFEVK